jgi:hypothetical protein
LQTQRVLRRGSAFSSHLPKTAYMEPRRTPLLSLYENSAKKIRVTVRLTQKAVEPSEATGQSRQITLDTHMLPGMSGEAADAMGEALE